MDNQLEIIDLSDKLISLRGQQVMLDSDVAALYGVETREINQAVKNNPGKFPQGYIINPEKEELAGLKSKILISNGDNTKRGGSRWTPKLFTEKGLYMLATILKGKMAERATLSIVETYSNVHALRRSLLAMHNEQDKEKQKGLMERFSEALTEIVMPELRAEETESSLEINFLVGKLKHTVKRRRTRQGDEVEQ